MKNLNKYLALPLVGLALAGCNDLDTSFQGQYVTTDQKAGVLEMNPEMAKAGVLGIPNGNNGYLTNFSDRNDFDFGYPGLMMMFDALANDCPCRYTGYNWFVGFQNFSAPNNTGDATVFLWNQAYKSINLSNTVIASMDIESENPEIQIMVAQGYAFRAMSYWMLAQCYQRNYEGREDMPCVPILTDKNSTQVAAEGAPRATVREVYEQILNDINTALTLVEKSGLQTSAINPSKPRSLFNADALYGLRARVYLTMHKYADAAADAAKAISISSCSPLTIDECSVPGFNGFQHNWLLGDPIAESDRVVTSGIINFPSMICSFSNGYVTAGVWRPINAKLYEELNKTDVRKGWFLDENYDSPILTDAQKEYLLSYGTGLVTESSGTGICPYTNVKFDSYKSVLGQTTNASDIPMMRIEEIYYIKAEAEIMSGNVGGGVQTLTDFVTTYRDPDFKVTSSDVDALVDIIWKQRRVELWGEGLSWFDLLRLNKGVDRVGGGFPTQVNYRFGNDDNCMLFCIPQSEIQYNKQISDDDNNPAGSRPSPVL